MEPFDVIVRPILSEKSIVLRENGNQYVFQIRNEASKDDVKRAMKTVWGVDTKTVRTIVSRGKVKRRGAQLSRPRKTKKAIVTLVEGAKLPLFEDQ